MTGRKAGHIAEQDGLPQPTGRPQGGFKSDSGRAAYWRMNYEAAIGALADLIAEHTELVEATRTPVTLDGPWIPDDQQGYSIALCCCEDGPYLGARLMGSPCCCERCGFMTQEQFDFLLTTMQGADRG